MPGEVAALIAATSAAPKGRRSPSASSSSTCMVNSPIRFMALSSSACTGSPLRCLSESSRRSHATARAGRSLRPTGATEVDRLVTQKPQNDLTLARHRPSWPKRACRHAWGKRGRAKLARITTGPSTATFFSKLSVMFRSSLDTSIKPILCKEIGSDSPPSISTSPSASAPTGTSTTITSGPERACMTEQSEPEALT